MRKHWLLIVGCFLSLLLQAQSDTTLRSDSTAVLDTATAPKDTVVLAPPPPPKPSILLDSSIYNQQPFFSFTQPMRQTVSKREWEGKEAFFYTTLGLLIFFALVRNGFSRYNKDLFKMFFRTTIKQRQIKEQLMAAPLPSLLLNILFFLSGALFINLLLNHYGLGNRFNFWILFLYCIAGLTLVYVVKFITLKITGWIFRLSDATDAYTFIVFTTNKIIGVALLPFIILLSFTTGTAQQAIIALSLMCVGALFLYRYYLSFTSIQRTVRINFFHFILYLAAFEIIPLLLINKLLFRILGESS